MVLLSSIEKIHTYSRDLKKWYKNKIFTIVQAEAHGQS